MNKILCSVFITITLFCGCSSKFKLPEEELSYKNDWPFIHNDLAGSGAIDNSGFKGKLDIIWEYKTNDKPAGPLTIYKNRLVYPGTRNKIKFFDKLSGDYDGYVKPRGTPQTGLVVKDSLAYFAVGAKKSKLKCVNLLNNKTIWENRLKDAVGGSIIIEEKLIIGSTEGVLYAFDWATGDIIWKMDYDSRFIYPPLFGQGQLIQTTDDGQILFLDVDDGSQEHSVSLSESSGSTVLIDNGLYAVDFKGNVYRFDMENKSMIWKHDFNLTVWNAPAMSNRTLYFSSSNGLVTALDAERGEVVWQYDAVDVIKSSVIVTGDYVLFGTMTGNFYSLDKKTGMVVSKRTLNGPVSVAPVSDGERVYVATDRGIITCFGDNNESTQNSN